MANFLFRLKGVLVSWSTSLFLTETSHQISDQCNEIGTEMNVELVTL